MLSLHLPQGKATMFPRSFCWLLALVCSLALLFMAFSTSHDSVSSSSSSVAPEDPTLLDQAFKEQLRRREVHLREKKDLLDEKEFHTSEIRSLMAEIRRLPSKVGGGGPNGGFPHGGRSFDGGKPNAADAVTLGGDPEAINSDAKRLRSEFLDHVRVETSKTIDTIGEDTDDDTPDPELDNRELDVFFPPYMAQLPLPLNWELDFGVKVGSVFNVRGVHTTPFMIEFVSLSGLPFLAVVTSDIPGFRPLDDGEFQLLLIFTADHQVEVYQGNEGERELLTTLSIASDDPYFLVSLIRIRCVGQQQRLGDDSSQQPCVDLMTVELSRVPATGHLRRRYIRGLMNAVTGGPASTVKTRYFQLTVMVMTEPENFARRMAIRNTWARASSVQRGVTAVYFAYYPSTLTLVQALNDEESSKFKDMVPLRMEKDQVSATNKTMRAIMHAHYSVKTFFSMFVSDDTWLALEDLPGVLPTYAVRLAFLANFDNNAEPSSDPSSPYYCTSNCPKMFPKVARGPFILSRLVTKTVAEQFDQGKVKEFENPRLTVSNHVGQIQMAQAHLEYFQQDKFMAGNACSPVALSMSGLSPSEMMTKKGAKMTC